MAIMGPLLPLVRLVPGKVPLRGNGRIMGPPVPFTVGRVGRGMEWVVVPFVTGMVPFSGKGRIMGPPVPFSVGTVGRTRVVAWAVMPLVPLVPLVPGIGAWVEASVPEEGAKMRDVRSPPVEMSDERSGLK